MAKTRNGGRVSVSPPRGDASGSRSARNSGRSRHSRTDAEDSTFSITSTAVISDLRGQLRDRDLQLEERDQRMNRMEAAMRAAGIIMEETVTLEDEGDSHHVGQGVDPRPVVQNLRGSTYKVFRSCQPPSFKGGDDPLVCKRWISKMEQVFDSADFTERQKVSYAVRMLEGEAMDWWNSIERGLSEVVRRNLVWAQFVAKVNTRFCNLGAIQRNEREFLTLQKGSMRISKYCSTFYEKLQFAGHYCLDERTTVARFVEGLPYPYKNSVRSQATLELAMEEARRVEDDLDERDKISNIGEKRKSEGSSGPSKKGNFDAKKTDQKGKGKFCNTCNATHSGSCS